MKNYIFYHNVKIKLYSILSLILSLILSIFFINILMFNFFCRNTFNIFMEVLILKVKKLIYKMAFVSASKVAN